MELEVWLINEAWNLEQGAQYPVRLYVDDHQKLHARAEVKGRGGVYIPVRRGEWLFELLKKGDGFYIDTEGEHLGYDLSGSFKALSRMRACTEEMLQAERSGDGPINPFAKKRLFDSASGLFKRGLNYTYTGPDDAGSKAFALNALMMPPLRHYQQIAPGDFDGDFDKFAVAWHGEGVFGVISRLEGLDLDDLGMALTRKNTVLCKGAFDSSKTPFKLRDGSQGLRLQIFCHNDEAFSRVISLYPADNDGFYSIFNFSQNNADAQKADAQFHTAIEDMMRGY